MSSTERLGGMLIFCIVFLGMFIALVAAIPSGFFLPSSTYTQYTYPDYFSRQDVEHIKWFKNLTMSYDEWNADPQQTYDFSPNATFKFTVYWNHWYTLAIRHITWEWWVFSASEAMQFNGADQYFSKALLVQYWDEDYNASVFYPVTCPSITVKVWVTDTNSSRNDIEAAFDAGSVNLAIGFGMDDYSTTISAWNIIGNLLTFQSPEILGMTGIGATILNLLIALPTWACIAYLVYRLILMAIPFVGG